MLTYIALAAAILALLAWLPQLYAEGFGAPPILVWLLLALAALVMIFRGRRRGED